jgi:ubiquinone/menaquinone biosynthesis C-methylase UbiE
MNALSTPVAAKESPSATPQATATPDYEAIKTRQKAAWASGDYAVVGTTLQIVGESLCEAMDLRAGSSVLDVAAGNGNATLAAARRWCEVTSTDYVPALLERGRERAAAEDLLGQIVFQEADAEALPYADKRFDAVVSTFGCMFAPNAGRVAHEMIRVCRPGGQVGMANWTPEGYIGNLFKTIGKHVPPPAGVKSPALWGSRDFIAELFEAQGTVRADVRQYVFRYRSPEHMLDTFRTFYGPVLKAFAALDTEKQAALAADLLALIARFNRADDGTVVLPSDYLQVVFTRS